MPQRHNASKWMKRRSNAIMLKWLFTLIAALLVLGLLTPWLNRLGLGRLPGDLRVKHARGTFYFPFTSVVLMSLLLSLLAWLFGR